MAATSEDRNPGGDRPRVVAALAVSADGRTAIAGRARQLLTAAHRSLIDELRAQCDAVLMGTRAIAREGAEPAPGDRLTVLATRTMQLRIDAPLFRDPRSRVLVISAAPVVLPLVPAQVTLERVDEENLQTAPLLRRLHAAHGVRNLLCPGGPTVVGALAAAGALDTLHLTVAPVLAGAGQPPVLARELATPAALRLQDCRDVGDGAVRLTYGLTAPGGP